MADREEDAESVLTAMLTGAQWRTPPVGVGAGPLSHVYELRSGEHADKLLGQVYRMGDGPVWRAWVTTRLYGAAAQDFPTQKMAMQYVERAVLRSRE